MRRLPLALLIILPVVVSMCVPSLAGELSYSAGVGYEFLSQEFFEDSLGQSGVDSLATITQVKTTYLDDFRGEFALRYSPFQDDRMELGASYEQTPDFLRVKLTSRYRQPRGGSSILQWNGELVVKEAYSGDTDASDSYVNGYGKAKLVLPVSDNTQFWGQLRTEYIHFDSTTSFSFNHYRVEGKLGVTQYFSGLSMLDVDLFYQLRGVPDSSNLDYDAFGAELAWFGLYGKGDIDLFTRVESRGYEKSGGVDNYLRMEVDLRNRIRLGRGLVARQEFDLEVLSFDNPDILNNNYIRTGLDLLIGWERDAITVALGPHLELLNEKLSDTTSSEEYVETGLKTELDYFGSASLFLSFESLFGYRNLQRVDDLSSDFVFERIDLMADWEIVEMLHANLLLSAQWEWHDNDSDDNQIMLISGGLSYGF